MTSLPESFRTELWPAGDAAVPQKVGNYVLRLQEVADKSFGHGHLLGGTTILNPSVVCHDRRGRLQEKTLWKFGMYSRELQLSNGRLGIYPLRTTGISLDGQPIIEARARAGHYSIVHVPETKQYYSLANPAHLTVDFVFTVNREDDVRVADLQLPTSAERLAFDSVVALLEERVAGVTPEDMRLVREAACYR